MGIINIQVTKIERLRPDTRIGPVEDGNTATHARVTRFYNRDTVTDTRTEYGIPIIEVLWGKDLLEVQALLESEKAALLTAAADRVAKIDADIANLAV